MMGLVLFDNTVIGDKTPEGKSIYRRVKQSTGLSFSRFGYCDTPEVTQDQHAQLHKMGYELKFFDGCFEPYLCRRAV